MVSSASITQDHDKNLMECVHVIVETSHDAGSMDTLSKSFIKKFKMPQDDKLSDYTYFIPLSTISHLLCVFNTYGRIVNEFFCVFPQRKWSGFFSVQIRVHNDINSEQNVAIDDLWDSSMINLDDHRSFDYGVDSSTCSLDFGDSSDDSSQFTLTGSRKVCPVTPISEGQSLNVIHTTTSSLVVSIPSLVL